MNEAEELSNLTTMAFKEGFQKGKLEQKKEELFFLKSLTEVTVDIAIIRIYDRVRQLQKEIGGKGE